MSQTETLQARLQVQVGRLALDVALDTSGGPLVLIGPNGAGKSSLLRALLGIVPVARGVVRVGDTVLLDTGAGVHVPVEHRALGYVPQDYALFPHLHVRANVAFALGSSALRLSRAAQAERVDAVLRDLGLSELAQRRVQTLSGGERQRVALARALSIRPRALLLDEPLSALDVHARREVRLFLATTLQELALPTVVVTHDPADARALGGRVVVLEEGRVAQVGSWDELTAAPASRFVAEFVSADELR
jgi:molybdate transport system ATP-binding protein